MSRLPFTGGSAPARADWNAVARLFGELRRKLGVGMEDVRRTQDGGRPARSYRLTGYADRFQVFCDRL